MIRQFRQSAVVLVLTAIVIGFASPSQAHNNPTPTPDMGHALLWDPAWGVDTPQGRLFEILAEDPTPMASTTKSWTLHVALQAVAAGQVALTDVVTADADTVYLSPWVPTCSSLMNGSSCMAGTTIYCCNPQPSLQVGEQVMFGDLLRGMMYPSGNDAAALIAKHVARGIWGPSAGVKDFVDLMTVHAWVHGFTDTWFTNPAGVDGDPSGLIGGTHQTSPRDQVRWWFHAYESHALFREIVGLSGSYSFTTGFGFFTKSYAYTWGNPYPGWQGHKGGDTAGCSGPNEVPANLYSCLIISAERLGRPLVLSFMQGKSTDFQPLTGVMPLFDYGFARVFHPDFRGQSVPWGANVQDHDLACTGEGRAVSAVFRHGYPLKLIVWGTDVDGFQVPKLGESESRLRGIPITVKLPFSQVDDGLGRDDPRPEPRPGPPGKGGQKKGGVRTVEITQMIGGTFATAARAGNQITLSRWFVGSDHSVSFLGSVNAGIAVSYALQRVQSDIVFLALRHPNGTLTVQTWGAVGRLGSAFALLDEDHEPGFSFSEVRTAAVAPATLVSADVRVVTVANTINDLLVHQVWRVDSATGKITKQGILTENRDAGGLAIASVPVPIFSGEVLPLRYVGTAFRESGTVRLRFYSIGASGAILGEGPATDTTEDVHGVRLTSFLPNGLLLTGRQGDGNSRFVVFDLQRAAITNNISPLRIAEHVSLPGSDLEPCRQATLHATADIIVAREEPLGALRVGQYRIGDLPY